MVNVLTSAGIETFESCEGGAGHAYPEPTIRFHGHRAEGFRALAVALEYGLRVKDLRRVWPVLDGEPTGPYWEMVFANVKTMRKRKQTKTTRRKNPHADVVDAEET